ncbi:unnamed protein product, partial [Heterosigma akashiwo]
IPLGDSQLSFGTGSLALLADGCSFVQLDNTSIMATVVSDPAAVNEEDDFLPLTVDYREKASAGGFIPRTRNRREPNNSDRETLTSRAIDRVLRPVFPPGYVHATQVLCTLQSCDAARDDPRPWRSTPPP